MNKYIKRQLDKVDEVDLIYDDNTTKIIIPKKHGIRLEEGKCYTIRLSANMLHPSANSTIVTNWNNNLIPTSEYYQADIIKIMNKMVKINGLAPDNSMWSGWVPIEELTIVNQL